MSTTKTRVDITFRGRVQGVGFRATTCEVARRFDVTGWVRNEPDGSVRMVVEGPDEEVDAFRAAHRDALGRSIDDTDEARSEATGEFDSFGVRY